MGWGQFSIQCSCKTLTEKRVGATDIVDAKTVAKWRVSAGDSGSRCHGGKTRFLPRSAIALLNGDFGAFWQRFVTVFWRFHGENVTAAHSVRVFLSFWVDNSFLRCQFSRREAISAAGFCRSRRHFLASFLVVVGPAPSDTQSPNQMDESIEMEWNRFHFYGILTANFTVQFLPTISFSWIEGFVSIGPSGNAVLFGIGWMRDHIQSGFYLSIYLFIIIIYYYDFFFLWNSFLGFLLIFDWKPRKKGKKIGFICHLSRDLSISTGWKRANCDGRHSSGLEFLFCKPRCDWSVGRDVSRPTRKQGEILWQGLPHPFRPWMPGVALVTERNGLPNPSASSQGRAPAEAVARGSLNFIARNDSN